MELFLVAVGLVIGFVVGAWLVLAGCNSGHPTVLHFILAGFRGKKWDNK